MIIDPVTITLAVIGAIRSVSGVLQQNAQAERVKKDANAAYNFNMFQLNQQKDQVVDVASQEAAERARQGLRERAMIAASGGEYGVTGNTLERLAAASLSQEDYDTGIMNANLAAQQLQLNNEEKSLQLRTQAAIANADASKIGLIGGITAAAGGALQGYQAGQGLAEQIQGILPSNRALANTVGSAVNTGLMTALAVPQIPGTIKNYLKPIEPLNVLYQGYYDKNGRIK